MFLWTADDGEHVKETCWPYMGELMAAFAEYDNGTTRFACDTWCFTPDQAIETTLGRGECHDATVGRHFVCSECEALVDLRSIGRSFVDEHGKRWYATSDRHGLNFCPNCGRRCVG